MANNTGGVNQRFLASKIPSGWRKTFTGPFAPKTASKWTAPTEVSMAAYQKSLEPYKGKSGQYTEYGDRGGSSISRGYYADAQTEADLNAATSWAISKGLIKDPGKIGFAEVAPLLAFAAPAAAAAGLFAGAGAAGAAASGGTAATGTYSGAALAGGSGTVGGTAAAGASGGAAAGTAAGGAAAGGIKLGTLADAATVGVGALGLLGSGEAVEQTPVPSLAAEPEPVMPTVDSAAIARRRRRSLMAQLARRGRESTILTDPLGG